MPDAGTLHDAFIKELRDTYDAEQQLAKALPKLADAAHSEDLRSAFEEHLEETLGHVERLEAIFESFDEQIKGKHCEGIAGIIAEGAAVLGEDFDEATKDAALIAAGQRAEHYEMAAYSTLIAWARAMGHTGAADLLRETLREERSADERLSAIAEGGVNQEAADGAHAPEIDEAQQEDEDSERTTDRKAARPKGAGHAAQRGKAHTSR